jgi:hypothetical protein
LAEDADLSFAVQREATDVIVTSLPLLLPLPNHH